MPVWVRVVVLGSGGAVPTRARGAPSIGVLDWRGYRILLDAGEGVQLSLDRMGASPSSLDLVAVTHGHGDHVNGLPGLLQSMYVNERRRPLTLVAPPGVIRFVNEVLEATETKLGFRVEGVGAEGWGEYRVWESGGDSLTLKWFPTCHTRDSIGFLLEWRLRPRIRREVLEASGLRPGPWIRDSLARGLEGATRRVEPIRIAYTGDTAPCRSVLEAVRGVDVLIHDSTYGGDRRVEAVERGHSSSVDAALIAREAGVRVLVLHHISARYQGVEAVRLVREARRIHGGAILSWDGMRIEVRRS